MYVHVHVASSNPVDLHVHVIEYSVASQLPSKLHCIGKGSLFAK